jgi:hypothetical protein
MTVIQQRARLIKNNNGIWNNCGWAAPKKIAIQFLTPTRLRWHLAPLSIYHRRLFKTAPERLCLAAAIPARAATVSRHASHLRPLDSRFCIIKRILGFCPYPCIVERRLLDCMG